MGVAVKGEGEMTTYRSAGSALQALGFLSS
jgi:hypothetical protein